MGNRPDRGRPAGPGSASPRPAGTGRPAATTPNPPGTPSSRRADSQQRTTALRFRASRWWGGAVTAGPGDEVAVAEGQGRGKFRASHADREQVIEVLKAAFVQGRLAKDEFDLRVGHAFAARTHAELAAVTAGLPAEPTTAGPLTAGPPAPARAQIEPPVVRPGPLITVATAVCAGVWMFGFLVPWPRDAEGDPPHGVA